MRPTRRAQPYKRGAAARGPGAALSAMLAGATASGINPANQQRAMAKRRSSLHAALKRAVR